MQQTILASDQNQVFYVLKVNGVEVTARFNNPTIAESQRAMLPTAQQNVAIMETITANGNQMLLG